MSTQTSSRQNRRQNGLDDVDADENVSAVFSIICMHAQSCWKKNVWKAILKKKKKRKF
jgi:hypothetical protein